MGLLSDAAEAWPFRGLLIEHALAAFERQQHAEELIAGRDWAVDLEAATIAFDQGPRASIDLIGTESTRDHSWLWAWSNPSLALPPAALAASERLAELGRGLGVGELETPRLELAGLLSAYTLGAVATGLLDAEAYYRAPTGQALVLLLLRGPEFVLPALDALTFTRTLTLGAGQFELEHQPAIAAYLRRRGGRIEVEGSRWAVALPTGEAVRLSFDPHERLAGIDSDMSSPPRSSGPGPSVGEGLVEVRRSGSARHDALRRYRLLVDGIEVGRLGRGKTARVRVPAGRHTVQMEIDGATSQPLPIDVAPDVTLSLVCEPAASTLHSRDHLERPDTHILLRPSESS